MLKLNKEDDLDMCVVVTLLGMCTWLHLFLELVGDNAAGS